MSEEQELIHCPYNFSHVILKPRMAGHLIKCRQQHKLEKFETCPFNSTHDVPALELQYHTEICPDRKQLESYLYVLDEPQQQKQDCFQVEVPSLSSENWDEEGNSGGSYLDVKDEILKNQLIFRQPSGLSKAKRKEFVQHETQKFEKLKTSK